jgi:YHS domain-containing protein
MLRAIGLLLLALIFIPVLRTIIGGIAKAFLSVFVPDSAPGVRRAPTGPPKGKSFGGELHKDPVCGTYISEAAALTKQLDGRTYYFCSPACRDKFQG